MKVNSLNDDTGSELKKALLPHPCSTFGWRLTPNINRYDTGLFLGNGNKAKVYASWDCSSVDLHFSRMREYGIDGTFIGRGGQPLGRAARESRFFSAVKSTFNDTVKKFRDMVLDNALAAGKKYDAKAAINYDHSDQLGECESRANLLDVIFDD